MPRSRRKLLEISRHRPVVPRRFGCGWLTIAVLLHTAATLFLRRNGVFEPLVLLGGKRVAPVLRISFDAPIIQKSLECRVHLRGEMQQVIIAFERDLRDLVLAPADCHNNAVTCMSKLPTHFSWFFFPETFGAFY